MPFEIMVMSLHFPALQDEDVTNEEEGGLSQSGKELKKLLGRACGSNVMLLEGDDGNDDVSNYGKAGSLPFLCAVLRK